MISSRTPTSARSISTLFRFPFLLSLLLPHYSVFCAVLAGCFWECLPNSVRLLIPWWMLARCLWKCLKVTRWRFWFPGTAEAWREGEVRGSLPAVAKECSQLQHWRPLPGAGAVGPCTELLGEDFSTPGQVGACGCAQCSESGTCCHLFGWVLLHLDLGVEFGMSKCDWKWFAFLTIMFRTWRRVLSDFAPEQLWCQCAGLHPTD